MTKKVRRRALRTPADGVATVTELRPRNDEVQPAGSQTETSVQTADTLLAEVLSRHGDHTGY